MGWGLTPLQGYSQCILQPQPTGQEYLYTQAFVNVLYQSCEWDIYGYTTQVTGSFPVVLNSIYEMAIFSCLFFFFFFFLTFLRMCWSVYYRSYVPLVPLRHYFCSSENTPQLLGDWQCIIQKIKKNVKCYCFCIQRNFDICYLLLLFFFNMILVFFLQFLQNWQTWNKHSPSFATTAENH